MIILIDKQPTAGKSVELVFRTDKVLRRVTVDAEQVTQEILDDHGNVLDMGQWFHEHMLKIPDHNE